MNKYPELLEKLNWNNSIEVQSRTVQELIKKNDWDYTGCIINSSKGCWENLFKIFNMIEVNDRLLIDDYLFLLKDLNWTGSLIAFNKLKVMGNDELEKKIDRYYRKSSYCR